MNNPTLIIRVRGEHRAQAFADCLKDWRITPPKVRGGWWTIKTRGNYQHVRELGKLLRVRFALRCCGCAVCAAGRNCMETPP